MREDNDKAEATLSRDVIDVLVTNHRDFLRYVERRTGGDRALAEDIVQDAFVRSLARSEDEIRESAVGWFYRVLRNAVIDRHRRQQVANKRFDELTTELESSTAADEELTQIACACITKLADTLKPEYADALRRIEIEGMPVKDYADAVGISSSNAGVRIFRAREALKNQVARSCGTCAEHGCLDCTCDSSTKKNSCNAPTGDASS